MINKIIKIGITLSIIINMFSINSFAKYNYTYTLKAFELTRDNSEILYDITRTEDDKEYTNKDVLLTINLNKPVDEVQGFEISDDRKTLSKLLVQNETNTIVVEDISGNTKEISYNINNIDKVMPEILGVEDGGIYSSNKEINYMDNVGIKDIFIDRYSNLSIRYFPDYYDSADFKGIDVTSNSIKVRIQNHPKNTKYYMYYLNGTLKGKTTESQYNFTNLSAGTNYKIKVEAIDVNGNILESVSKTIKTKYFSSLSAKKNTDTFSVTLHGIDSKIDSAYGVGFTNENNQKLINARINSDRSLTINFSALDITKSLQTGYYYFHIHLFDKETNSVMEFVCCNVNFYENYTEKNESTDPYNLTKNGNYQIIVTDLAGNKTEKNITIQK